MSTEELKKRKELAGTLRSVAMDLIYLKLDPSIRAKFLYKVVELLGLLDIE
jgi:hypothetical protein